jgi:hypothetical protein
MSLALITQPAFLQRHFPYTRQGLLGQWPRRVSQVIETFSSYPAVEPESFAPLLESSAANTPEEISQVPQEMDGVPQVPLTNILTQVLPAQKTTKQGLGIFKSISRFVLTVVMVISLGVGAVLILPEIYYTVFSQSSAVGQVADAAKETATTQPRSTPEAQPYMPVQNPDLPTGSWLSIPRIGVYSEMHATIDENEALDKGVWLVPDFGKPGDTTQPIILAAHRFGWDWWWKSDYWKYNSFYLLTETEPGDRVEIIYDQRKWVYEIYAGEEAELISDYDADLIMYTCKYLNSPIRYFRYAKLIKE